MILNAPKDLIELLQKQMNEEYQAHYNYIAMANYFYDLDYDGFGAYYLNQADDERDHANHYRELLLKLDEVPIFEKLDKPKNTWKNPLDAIKDALNYEESITETTFALLKAAEKLDHYPSIEFLQAFVKEQINEIDDAKALVSRAQQLPNGQSIFFIDQELRA